MNQKDRMCMEKKTTEPICPVCKGEITHEDFTVLELAIDGEFEIVVCCPHCVWEPPSLKIKFEEFL